MSEGVRGGSKNVSEREESLSTPTDILPFLPESRRKRKMKGQRNVRMPPESLSTVHDASSRVDCEREKCLLNWTRVKKLDEKGEK